MQFQKNTFNLKKVAAYGFITFVLLCLFSMWAFFMHSVTVEPGQNVVLVDKPYFFGEEGVREKPLTEGRKLVFDTTTHEVVNMQPQSITVGFDDLYSSDNTFLDFESTIQWRVKDPVSLTIQFGKNWFSTSIKQQYMAVVRNAVKKQTMNNMLADVNAAQVVDDEVTSGLLKLVEEQKLPVVILSVALGKARPNANVLAQINTTAEQRERKKTLVESTAAEAQREIEQIAKARADNAYRNAMGLNPEFFVRLESIKRYSEACLKSERCVVNSGQADVVTPLK